MAKLIIQSALKITRVGRLPSRAISFLHSPASFGRENFRVDLKKEKPDLGMFYRR